MVWLFGFVMATTFCALDLSAEDWAFSLLLTVMWGVLIPDKTFEVKTPC